ncbi:hypothetical protein GDO81_029030 [Engystomops pustulosus]|uniref:Uncharacterized protein n=1 Tax=Engystomops pustulosus TaxID=76066 RepID=A0AAV6ZD83_ENGPU|nr:hypothetical protein GDO81_029030 [Engystomops pustulosus]
MPLCLLPGGLWVIGGWSLGVRPSTRRCSRQPEVRAAVTSGPPLPRRRLLQRALGLSGRIFSLLFTIIPGLWSCECPLVPGCQ